MLLLFCGMHSDHCLNCNSPLTPVQKYCSECSQPANTHRITIPHLIHETIHAITHADKGILHLVKGLATQPGIVVKEYLEGKRKKYYNPFTFLLICLGLVVFVNSIVHPFEQKNLVDPNVLAHMSSEDVKHRYIGMMTRMSRFTHFAETNSNILFMISSPIMSLVYMLSFGRKRFNYSEYVVATVFFGGFYSIVSAITIYPLMGYTKGTSVYPYVAVSNFILHGLYYGWGFYQLMGSRSKILFLRTFLVSMLTILVWVILSTTFSILYMRYG